MPLHSYFVLFAFTVLLIVLVFQYLMLKKSGSGFLGSPAIEKLYFYSGKFALFATWALFMLKAISPRLGYIYMPDLLSWLAVGLLYVGGAIFSFAVVNLGKSLQIGLPGAATILQTHGIYRFSRNPIYIGVETIALASCIYFPDLINVSFALYGIYIHHKIIRQEECFLAERFGNEWTVYCAKVPRYV